MNPGENKKKKLKSVFLSAEGLVWHNIAHLLNTYFLDTKNLIIQKNPY